MSDIILDFGSIHCFGAGSGIFVLKIAQCCRAVGAFAYVNSIVLSIQIITQGYKSFHAHGDDCEIA
ncbi:hypothetical protein D3C87_2114950 [compost metagenome]